MHVCVWYRLHSQWLQRLIKWLSYFETHGGYHRCDRGKTLLHKAHVIQTPMYAAPVGFAAQNGEDANLLLPKNDVKLKREERKRVDEINVDDDLGQITGSWESHEMGLIGLMSFPLHVPYLRANHVPEKVFETPPIARVVLNEPLLRRKLMWENMDIVSSITTHWALPNYVVAYVEGHHESNTRTAHKSKQLKHQRLW